MSGHSHWATIKHKKGAIDAKRGKLWSKLSRAIIIAARHGGGDPDMNLKLRYAIDKARQVSMPKDNIDRAIKRGTGETDGVIFEELTYEGYGSGGVAVLVDVLTDNRNRTSGEVRKIFERAAAKWAPPGPWPISSTARAFSASTPRPSTRTRLMGVILEAGADDLKLQDESSRSSATRRSSTKSKMPWKRPTFRRPWPKSRSCPRCRPKSTPKRV